MAVFGKLAYDAGVSVDALLLVRFGLAGTLLLVLALARGALRNLPRRAVLTGLGMGVFGYAAQSGCTSPRLPASTRHWSRCCCTCTRSS